MTTTEAPDILRMGNYYVSYNYDTNTQIGEIFISFLDASVLVQYKDGKVLVNNACDKIELPESIECPFYAAAAIVNYVLRMACEQLHYPLNYLILYENNNRIASFSFGRSMDEKEIEKSSAFGLIYADCIDTGLVPEHIEFAKESDVYAGLQVLADIWLGVTLGE